MHTSPQTGERALLVGIERKRGREGWRAASSLDELSLLAQTTGAEVAAKTLQRLDTPPPGDLLYECPSRRE